MKLIMQKNNLFAVLAAGVIGLSGNAVAQQFTIGATVSNAITITETTPFSFGNLFATTTKTGGLTTDSARITLNADGTMGVGVPGNAPPIVYLGNAEAGAYLIPGVPIGSDVVVEIQDSAGTAITNGAADALCNYADAAAALAAGRVILTAGGPGLGNSFGFFCVDAFRARSNGTDVTAALIGVGAGGGTGLSATAQDVAFTLGATLIGQSGIAVTNFQTADYSGVFNMEVLFK